MKKRMADQSFMHRALTLALKAKGRTSPNPIVGAVLVKGGKVIARGWHHRCGADHAEVVALKQAGRSARGAKMYVTLEPCFHFGRTAPCVDRIIESGIKEVVIGMKDPNPLTNGKSIVKLRRAGIKARIGILSMESAQLNEVFIKYIKTRMPFVVAKCAQTIDGKIATATGDSKWITSKQTRQHARQLRDQFDAIMVGINTVLKDNPRLNGVKKKNLKKIILDSSLRVSPKATIFSSGKASDCFVVTTGKASKAKIKLLEKKGVNVLIVPQSREKILLKWLLKELAEQDITSVLIEGGANVIGSALKEKVVDKMHIYIAPKIFGDSNALNSIIGLNVRNIKQSLKLYDVSLKQLTEDIFVEGYVHRNH